MYPAANSRKLSDKARVMWGDEYDHVSIIKRNRVTGCPTGIEEFEDEVKLTHEEAMALYEFLMEYEDGQV